jgi:hypothetical protein
MNTREIITNFAGLANYKDPEKFWELIKEENKQKKWSLTPVKIEFKDGQIVENSEQVKRLVGMLQNWADNELQTKSINTLEKDTEIVRTVYEWFSGSRKKITKKFDEIKKNFTGIEADIKNIGLAFKQRKEELLEEEYQNREAAILAELKMELHSVKEEYGIELNTNLFSDFIAAKRKTKVLTDTGKLTKKIKDEIKAKVRKILEPILKEREAQKLKEQDLQKLTLDMQDVNINALFIDELENSKIKLQQLLNTAEMRYPNATQEAEAQIKANIKIVEANIARLKAEQEKEALKKAEEERKAAELKIKARAEAIQKAQMQQKEEVQEVKKAKYKIPLEEIEVIAAVEFEAESEEEAKQKAIEMFKQQLSLIELIKI